MPQSGTFELASAGGEACDPLAPGSLSGKVALIHRGTCTFIVKGMNAATAGAVAIVFSNDAPGPVLGQPVVTGVPIPAVSISQENGRLIEDRLSQAPST